ncbi:RNA polymerase sigma factor [Hymenobacter caeli]|uniref:RNA polymerase sigma-70 factor (ECF subfamily) n=1 Tax=Hymenobacter caeli TaxID=2735894 RepID=A0ABX2FMK2_9BACT|nr:sigma-70 family RNA polymerase sigma factor [Hymenobacter caeli]NRT18372.1 RNA polymerase sigma-70 factor (ECF subfamily) [Hymenobacter caeli]
MPLFASSAPRVPRPLAGHDDAALVRALGAGSEAAFAEIYERYWYELYVVAYRKLGAPELAEEVVHDVLAALWQRRAQLAIDYLKAYLLGAARYRIIDALRARLAHAGYLDQQRPRQAAADHGTEDALAASDLSAALLAGLRQLPAHTQAVFRLSRFEHRSVPEIASRLRLSPKTVEYHLTRALKLLRVSLRDFVLLALVWLW